MDLDPERPIIMMRVHIDGRITLQCDGRRHVIGGLGMEQEMVTEEMLRDVMTYLDETDEDVAGRHTLSDLATMAADS